MVSGFPHAIAIGAIGLGHGPRATDDSEGEALRVGGEPPGSAGEEFSSS